MLSIIHCEPARRDDITVMLDEVAQRDRMCAQHDAVLTAWRWAFYLVIPHVSRGIQQPRALSVLQAFLDAATARSMTGGRRVAGVRAARQGDARSVTDRGTRAVWQGARAA